MTVVSQSAKCYQVINVSCGDTAVDYLTAKEKRNLYKLQVVLEQKSAEIEYLQSNARADSCYMAELNSTVDSLLQQVKEALIAKKYSDNAYLAQLQATRAINRQLKNTRVKAWTAGVITAVGAFGTGVAVTFVILKSK